MFDTIACPECEGITAILERFSLDSTDGPVEHVRTHCVNGHYLTVRAAHVRVARHGANEVPVRP